MGRALAAIAQASRDRYVVVGRAIWGIRRVNSDDLRQEGYAALEGSAAGREAAAQISTLRRKAQDLAAGATPEQVAEHEARLQQQLREIVEKRNASMAQTIEGDKALQRRLDGYVVAAVVRCGILRGDVQYPSVHILPDDVDPETIAIDLRSAEEISADKPPMYTEPVTIVRDEKDEDVAAGRLWLHSLSAEDRRALGLVVAQLQGQSALAEVTPFRDDAGAGGAAVASDARVPGTPTPRVPGADAVPAGTGRARRDRRAKERGGHGVASEGRVPRSGGR